MAELTTLARPYAKALFARARAGETVAPWHEALALSAAIAGEPEVRENVLGNPLVENEEAAAFFIDAGGERFDDGFRNFIRLLAENRRLGLLGHIAELYGHYRALGEQTLAVDVLASTGLDDEQKRALADSLEKRFGRDVKMAVEVDPSLLGGAVIYAGDTVIDGSLKSKLKRLNATLAQ